MAKSDYENVQLRVASVQRRDVLCMFCGVTGIYGIRIEVDRGLYRCERHERAC